MPPIVVVLLLVPVAGLALSLALVSIGVIRMMRRSFPTSLLIGLAGIGCAASLNHWHLIGSAPG